MASLALFSLTVPGPAWGGPLVSSTFDLTIRQLLPSASFAGAGATGTSTGALSASVGGTGVFDGVATTILPTTAAPPMSVLQVFVTKNGAATFTGATPSGVGGHLAIQGVVNVYGVGGFTTGAAPLLAVPLDVGTPNTTYYSASGVALTAIAGGWTAGTVTLTGVGTTSPTATAMGANGLTVNGGGTLVLVTPWKIITSVVGNLAAFGRLTLTYEPTYVPEPATLLLVAIGLVGLGVSRKRPAS